MDIRLASHADLPACFALVPRLRESESEFLIALEGGQIVGCAGLLWESWASPCGFPIWIEVVPSHRRQGFGRRLSAAAASLASGETAGLRSLRRIDEGTPQAGFLRSCGYEVVDRTHHFRVALAVFEPQVSGLWERFQRRRGEPQLARAVPLSEAPLDQVAWLLSSLFGGGPRRFLRLIEGEMGDGGEGRIDPECSSVALDNDEVVGVVLVRRSSEREAKVDFRAVSPSRRNGPVNLMLMARSAQQTLAHGYDVFQYQTDARQADSMKLAGRSGGERVATDATFYLRLR
ncbi:MAG: GNAT family N-acetyltransferase [Caulobacteraceae bacterium]